MSQESIDSDVATPGTIPAKWVRMWAEKEMRNLRRLVAAGIPCPEPIEVRENVLVMTFLGDSEGWASPRLKDAKIEESVYPKLYRELLLAVRRLFHTCRLVHADLSEYNILYHAEKLFVIDVSQSVEHDHPHAFDFLRKDITNVEDYFGRYGVRVLGLRRAFEFVTRTDITKEPGSGSEDGGVLERWLLESESGPADIEADVSKDGSASRSVAEVKAHEDAVFMKSYIPRNLNEVYDPERDVALFRDGAGDGLIYKDTIGLVGNDGETADRSKTVPQAGAGENDQTDESDTDEEDSGEEAQQGNDGALSERTLRGHRHEGREEKRLRKQATKEETREKRKNKMKKAEKKKKIKATRHG